MVIFNLPDNVFRSFVKKKIFNSIGLDPGVVRSRKSTTPNIVELHPGPSSNKELIKQSAYLAASISPFEPINPN